MEEQKNTTTRQESFYDRKEINWEYAGFWIRVGATLLDSILISLVFSPLLILFYGTDYYLNPSDSLVQGPADFFISWVLPAIAVILFWVYKQATLGKMLTNIKIVDAKTGCSPTLKQYIIRYLGYFVSSIPLGLGCLWVAWDPKKQSWHDKMAGTLVIHDFGLEDNELDNDFENQFKA